MFDKTELKTTAGEPLEILAPGRRNTDAGPDFFNARIKIGETVWAGNVEVHLRASDWNRHIHDKDKAYDNVILHVVGADDKSVVRTTGQPLPAFEMRYNPQLEARYDALLQSADWIPCGHRAANIALFRIKHFLSRLLVERLEQKSAQINDTLAATRNDWHEAFHQLLFRAFGFGVNALPFELLAKSIPPAAIAKQRASLLQIEALLFGQAGLLNDDLPDDYHAALKKEYLFLRNKYSLKPIEPHLWKFLRIRPSNFPTIRIAQLAQLLSRPVDISEQVLAFGSISELQALFAVQASDYWNTHYHFGKESKKQPKPLGKSSAQRIIINLIVPYLFAYGKAHANEPLCEKALAILETLPPESNHIIAGWKHLGIAPENAFYAQSLIQLKTAYCNSKQCLSCAIGIGLLKENYEI